MHKFKPGDLVIAPYGEASVQSVTDTPEGVVYDVEYPAVTAKGYKSELKPASIATYFEHELNPSLFEAKRKQHISENVCNDV